MILVCFNGTNSKDTYSISRLKLQEITFASNFKAIYVTLRPEKRADLRAVTSRTAPYNAIAALRWRFEPVKHLYSKYIPPPEIVPADLPPDILAAYREALDAETSRSESSKMDIAAESSALMEGNVETNHNLGSTQRNQATPSSELPINEITDASHEIPENALRTQVAKLRAKLESTRREIENKDQILSPHLVDEMHRAESELETQLRRFKKVSDSVAGLKHDIRRQDSAIRAEKKRRRQIEQDLADAQNAVTGAQADHDSSDSTRLETLRESRDRLRHLTGVRETELKKRQEARQGLEDELECLKFARAGLITVAGKESAAPAAVPALIRAFSHLHSANLQA